MDSTALAMATTRAASQRACHMRCAAGRLGARHAAHFQRAFEEAHVDAAGRQVFHSGTIEIGDLKRACAARLECDCE